MKKTVLVLLALVMLLASVAVIPASATVVDPGETVTPMWDNILQTNMNFGFGANNVGSADIAVTGKLGTTQILITINIYKEDGNKWVLIAEGSKTFTSLVATHSVMFDGISGGYYKAEYHISVSRLGTTETILETKYVECE